MKESKWQPCECPPDTPGVYKRKDFDGETGWQRWNGMYWCLWRTSIDSAKSVHQFSFPSLFQHGHWKGLIA